MASDAVLQFLERAKSVPLLPPDQAGRLPAAPPDDPDLDLPAFCDRLAADGVLTPFQAGRARDGRADELAVGSYALIEERHDSANGTAYRARHTATGDEVTLVPLSGGPVGARLQAIADLEHPHLALGGTLLEGENNDWWLIRRPGAGADLAKLVGDIGPMPYPMAANFARQVAQALSVAHGKGLVHGAVRPTCWYVAALTPLPKPKADGTPRHRPAPGAAVLLDGWDAPPHPIPLQDLPTGTPAGAAVFLPPERVTNGALTAAGDVYGLGATLFFLLTGRPPLLANTLADLLPRLRDGAPLHLSVIRPDAPPDLIALTEEMLRRDPERRPSARSMVERLAALGREPVRMSDVLPDESELPELDLDESPDAAPRSAVVRPESWIAPQPAPREPEPAPAAPPAPAAEYTPAEYTPPALEQSDPDASPVVAVSARPAGGSAWKVWLAVGLALNLLGVLGWVYLFGGFSGAPPEEPPAKKGRR